MANTKEIQDRIKSINDTLKITNAMYMISSQGRLSFVYLSLAGGIWCVGYMISEYFKESK